MFKWYTLELEGSQFHFNICSIIEVRYPKYMRHNYLMSWEKSGHLFHICIWNWYFFQRALFIIVIVSYMCMCVYVLPRNSIQSKFRSNKKAPENIDLDRVNGTTYSRLLHWKIIMAPNMVWGWLKNNRMRISEYLFT